MIFKTISVLCVMAILSACASSSKTASADPLQNSKKLFKEGHMDLYQNGAFQVPATEIKLIPAGPSALELAGEFAGLRARQSFLLSLKNAQSAVYLISDGTKKSYSISQDIFGVGNEFAEAVTKVSRPTGKTLILKSAGDAYGIAGTSFEFSKTTSQKLKEFSADVESSIRQSAEEIKNDSQASAEAMNASGVKFAQSLHEKGLQRSGKTWKEGQDSFVKGYLELPQKWQQYPSGSEPNKYFSEMRDNFAENDKWQDKNSEKMQTLVKSSSRNYFSNIGESLGNASSDFSNSLESEGISFATLKASRWVLQALFYDAMIAPLSKITYGSLGYIFVNGIAYPVLLVKDGSVAAASTAVQYTWDSTRMMGNLVAPTAQAAFAAVVAGADLIGTEVAAGSSYAGAKAGTALVTVTGKVASVVVQGSGYLGSKGIYYIGVPLGTAGVAVGGTAVGAVYGASEAVTGSAIYLSGEVAQVTSRAVGATTAGVVLVGGTVGSTTVGSGLAVYEVSKSVVVPASYELGGGIVLGYSSMSHLAAHSVLAVADASYLVLSMEGPRWVIYAVSGKTGGGENIPAGTVVDLKEMKKQGEEFHYVPASQDEVKSVIEALPTDLPKTKEH